MPFIDTFHSLRERAGLRIASVAKAADLSRDTITRIEQHKNCTPETLVRAVEALNKLHYRGNGAALDPDALISVTSKFGSAT
jgi:transcriptional regulator with XRE-family HTH domain